jgi:hypothetical protein
MLVVVWALPLLHTVAVFIGLVLILATIYLVITLFTVPWLLFCVIALWVWHRAAQNSGREP